MIFFQSSLIKLVWTCGIELAIDIFLPSEIQQHSSAII